MPRGILIGAAVNARQVAGGDAVRPTSSTRQFSSISSGERPQVGADPPRGRIGTTSSPADQFVALRARRTGWPSSVTAWSGTSRRRAWVFAGEARRQGWPRRAAGPDARAHPAVVGRYRAASRAGTSSTRPSTRTARCARRRGSTGIGDDFIAKAFEFAHAADPRRRALLQRLQPVEAGEARGGHPDREGPAGARPACRRASANRRTGASTSRRWRTSTPRSRRLAAGTGVKVMLTELDIDVLPRDPDMWGADLSKKTALRAKTNIYPDGLPAEQQQQLARRYADIFSARPEAPGRDVARDVLGRDRRDILAPQLPDSRPCQLPAALGPRGAAEAGLRRGRRGAEDEAMTSANRIVPPYKDPPRPCEERVEDLLARMTLEEKVAQMVCVWQQKRDDARRRAGPIRRGEGRGRVRRGPRPRAGRPAERRRRRPDGPADGRAHQRHPAASSSSARASASR